MIFWRTELQYSAFFCDGIESFRHADCHAISSFVHLMPPMLPFFRLQLSRREQEPAPATGLDEVIRFPQPAIYGNNSIPTLRMSDAESRGFRNGDKFCFRFPLR